VAQHRIGELRIDVRARAGAIPVDREVRGYVGRVWEAVGDTLERRHPGRVYRIRSWEASWRLTRSALRSGADPALLADLVARCEAVGPTPIERRPDEAAEIVCFAGEGERVAAWWRERAAREPPHWAWADLDDAPSVDAVLAALPPADRAHAVRCVQRAERPERAPALLPPPARPAVPAAPGGEPAVAPSPPPVAPSAAVRDRAQPPGERPAAAGSGPPPPPTSDRVPGALAAPSAPGAVPARDGQTRAPSAPAEGRSLPGGADRERDAVRPAERTAGGQDRHDRDAAVVTGWGGLVHLLGPMVECGVGQALWEACLDERAVLYRALTALCGDDPAAFELSGGGAAPVLAGPEQLAEIRAGVLDGLRRAVPRRGLAAWPPLEPARTAGGLPCVRAAGLPWAVASWAEGPDADVDIAELSASDVPVGRVWSPDEPEAADAALIAIVVGAPATLLALRLGWTGGDAAAFAARWLRRPARILDDGEAIELRFGPEQVDLDLRRAGADADPGWIPWLRRTVRVAYDATEPD
jgi:hypothetical protein